MKFKDEYSPSSGSQDLLFEKVINNQAMRFGQLSPVITNLLSERFLKDEPSILPYSLLERTPLFDQAIFNLYMPGEGITPHVDLPKFEDGIVGISLVSSTVMEFSPASPKQLHSGYTAQDFHTNRATLEIQLFPGDVFSISGPARYLFTHTIPARLEDTLPDGKVRQREHRISITLRKLCSTINCESN